MGPPRQNLKVLGQLRLELGRQFELINAKLWAWAWVVDFPLYEENPDTGSVEPAHHAFTHPLPEHLDKLLSDDPQELLAIRADNCDLVLNGEDGQRHAVFDPELQRRCCARSA
jgi:aspartyl-tRNA synthetase